MVIILLLLVISVFLSAFFSGAEVALVSISELKARHLAEQHVKGAKSLLYLKDHPKRMLITILIGNNVVNIGGSALATKLAIDLFDSAGVGIATGVMTFLILTFGEIAPKTFATRNAKQVALSIAPMIVFLKNLLLPLVGLFLLITKAFEGDGEDEPLITEQEVQHIITVGAEEGQIKPDEREMIHRIFKFDDTEVEDVMTPRTEMFALDQEMSIEEAMPIISKQEFSRIPVFEEAVDHIKGVVFARELLQAVAKHKDGDDDISRTKLKDIAQKPLFIPEHKKIDKVLKELQRKKTHMAIIVNEHGGVEGLVTIEDLLEEIVGEIFDEADEVESLITKKSHNHWLVLGKTPLELINQQLGTTIPENDDYNTVAGLIQDKLGKVPEQGERCALKKHRLDLFVRKTQGPAILEVLINKH